MDIVLTKHIGIMGTAMLVQEKKEELLSKFPKSYLEKALKAREEMSVCSEARAAPVQQSCMM